MSKHILDRGRISGSAARSVQYHRIEADERPQLQSKALQKQPKTTVSPTSIRRFLDIERNKTDTL